MRFRLAAISIAIASCVATSSATAQGFGNFYAFGDSLTDCCNTPFARYTNYANGKSPNWADQVPLLIGASYTASPQSNFAIGGAQSGQHNINFGLEAGYGAPSRSRKSKFRPIRAIRVIGYPIVLETQVVASREEDPRYGRRAIVTGVILLGFALIYPPAFVTAGAGIAALWAEGQLWKPGIGRANTDRPGEPANLPLI